MSSTKRGLGGGLSNLFGGDVTDLSAAGAAAGGVTQLSLSRIEPNPNQPRKVFDPNALEELAESIRLHGVITPITVRAGEKSGYYQIIAGERRWRAARMAGLKEIPAMVLEARESEIMELALIENLQRQDLNPIEEAEGYDLLMRQFGLTQEEVARRVVKSRPAVANALRLLALPDEVRVMVSEGQAVRRSCTRRAGSVRSGQTCGSGQTDGRHDRAAGRGVGEKAEQKAGAKDRKRRFFRGLPVRSRAGTGKCTRPQGQHPAGENKRHLDAGILWIRRSGTPD